MISTRISSSSFVLSASFFLPEPRLRSSAAAGTLQSLRDLRFLSDDLRSYRFMRWLRFAGCSLLALGLTGCPSNSTSPPKSSTPENPPMATLQETKPPPEKPPEQPDDPAVAASLQNQGVNVRLNDHNQIIAVELPLPDGSLDTKEAAQALFTTIAGLKHLESVQAAGPGITDATVQPITGMKTLTTINSVQYRHHRRDRGETGGTPELTKLYIRRTNISDASLEKIGQMKNLKWLDLRYTNISDAGIRNLTGLKQLRELMLRGATNVTDEGLKSVAKLKSLVRLNLWGERLHERRHRRVERHENAEGAGVRRLPPERRRPDGARRTDQSGRTLAGADADEKRKPRRAEEHAEHEEAQSARHFGDRCRPGEHRRTTKLKCSI